MFFEIVRNDVLDNQFTLMKIGELYRVKQGVMRIR
jgi:hypothetical protein